jgi:hypothetical protein
VQSSRLPVISEPYHSVLTQWGPNSEHVPPLFKTWGLSYYWWMNKENVVFNTQWNFIQP